MRSSLSVLQSTSSSKALAAPRVHSRHTATYSALRVSHPSRAVTCRGGMTSSGTNNFFARRTPATGGAGGAAAMHSSAAASTSAARSSPGRLAALFSSAGSSSWASSDLRAYHDRYPGQRQHAGSNKNLLFYTNQIVSVPSGAKIDTMHATWFGQHDLLEAHHGYIQWIFPIREDGMNSQSQMLMLHEIAALKADPAFPKRLLSSYRMMLDFYGMQLADPKTGRVVRGANYRARYAHLNRSTHNYLRITRILKCLGELGQEHLKLGFLLLIVREITLNELKPASVGRSAVNYWFPTLRSPSDRARLQSVIDELVAAEAAAPEGKEVTLSERRIAQVLEEAHQQRTGGAAGTNEEEGSEDEATDDGAPAASSSNGSLAKHAGAGAAAGPSSNVGFVSDSEGEDEGEEWDTDSPRADAEAMVVSRAASSETDKGQTVAAAGASSAVAASPSAASASAATPAVTPAAAAAAPTPTLLSKRKSVDGAEEADGGMVDDSPRAKKAQTPTSNGHANGNAQ